MSQEARREPGLKRSLPAAVDGAQMLALARDRSRAGREALATMVAKMVALRGAELTAEEEALAADILRTLIRDVERSVRTALAANLAASAAAPRDVILALAGDDIEVAFPILAESPIIEDEELARLVIERATGHRIAIAMRPGLSETVSDALIESEDQEAIVCLLHNAEAHISEAGMERLVEGARTIESYHAPLSVRSELSPHLALKLSAFVSEELQERLAARGGFDPSEVGDVAERAVEDAAKELVRTSSAVGDDKSGRRRDVRQMIDTLRRHEWPHFEAAMVRFSGLSPRLIHAILTERDGRRLTVLCRACGVHKSDFAPLYLLSRRATPDGKIVDADDVREALALFDSIAKSAAERAVYRWRVQSDAERAQAARTH